MGSLVDRATLKEMTVGPAVFLLSCFLLASVLSIFTELIEGPAPGPTFPGAQCMVAPIALLVALWVMRRYHTGR